MTRTLLVLIATGAVLMTQPHNDATAALKAQPSREIVIQFGDDLVCEPYAHKGVLYADGAVGKHTIGELSTVAYIRPKYPRGTPGQSLAGPWIVGLLSDADEDSMASLIENHSFVKDAWAGTSAESPPVSGEVAKAVFPLEEEFCTHQEYFHQRAESEPIGFGDCGGPTASFDTDYDLPQAWAITRGDSSVVIAIVDSGVDWVHPDLGGPGPTTSVADSLEYYNGGSVFRNWREYVGDSSPEHDSPDNCPGDCFVDDDDDGKTDEDSFDRDRSNEAEPFTFSGTVSSVDTLSIVATGITVPEDSLAGLWLFGNAFGNFSAISDSIVSNTATAGGVTSIETAGVGVFGQLIDAGLTAGWITYSGSGVVFKTGDLDDYDDDGFYDDVGWLNDLVNDDDENSFEDDLRGWDVVDYPAAASHALAYPNGDYTAQDNNPWDLFGHGTWIASQVGAIEE